jgi:hypothetical protein
VTATKRRRLNRPILSALVDPETQADVRAFAAKNDMSVSDVVRRGVGLALRDVAVLDDDKEGAEEPCTTP